MLGTFRPVFLVCLTALFTVQLLGTACLDDGVRERSGGPLHAQDQLPGTMDGQTETDGSAGEGEWELALAQSDGLRVILRTDVCSVDHAPCPRTTFVSDWFRPPAHS